MEVKKVNHWLYSLSFSDSDAARIGHYAGIAKMSVIDFIGVALLMHMVSYKRCPGYEPDISDIGDDHGEG